ncbi:3-oxoacyl-ACP synthase III family protein [Amycolatopsis sp. CA-126428]|uniref:3-oxoacyl-ACP synthase III family protein n=1 Tax=Amycolatopsis sp. CA-126428 TaxID=2073158 RepID=UPI000CD05BFC|nr:beta-ketoacyl-ACP synthase 3 [Amycolatopsis sp. CA-126428]
MSVVVSGVGTALPATVVGNDAFEDLGVTGEWIVERTGVHHRHRLQPGERLAGLAATAASRALADAEVAATDVDFVVAATTTPDRVSPGLAPEIGHLIGAASPGAVDVNGACTGFLYALDYAISRISHGSADRVLVVGADAMSRLTDPADRNTAVLFGDGAGAVLVEASRGETCEDCVPFLSFGSAPEHAGALFVDHGDNAVRMDGAQVYASAVEAMTDVIRSVLTGHEITEDDVDLLVCHQANSRILAAVVRRLKWRPERAASYVGEFGNTSSASIPLALGKAQDEGRLKPGHTVVLSAFGAGFTWGAGVLGWKACRHT